VEYTDHQQEDFVVLVVLGRGSAGAINVDEGGGPPQGIGIPL